MHSTYFGIRIRLIMVASDLDLFSKNSLNWVGLCQFHSVRGQSSSNSSDENTHTHRLRECTSLLISRFDALFYAYACLENKAAIVL
jgi:hypothetical protein